MTKEQIQLLKSTYNTEAVNADGNKSTCGEYMRFCLDNSVDFVTSKDLIVYDDDNELMHCVCINDDAYSQYNYPVKIITTTYEMVQHVEAILTNANFETVMSDGFLANIGDERKTFMRNYLKRVPVQATQPNKATPYYSSWATVIPATSKKIAAEKTSDTNVKITSVSGDTEAIVAAITAANDGDVLLISNNAVIDQDLTIEKSICLKSNGATVTGKVNITADDVSISGFNFDYTVETPSTTKDKTVKLMTVSGKNATISDSTFTSNTYVYNDIYVTATGEINITGNVFGDCDNLTYNTIEFSQSAAAEKISITGNSFLRTNAQNNHISIFMFNDDDVVEISDNIFERSANALRISNYTNAKNVKIVCTNNKYYSVDEESPDWIGFVLFQAVKGEDFSNVTCILKNLVGPGGKVMTSNGTSVNQVWYTYNTETVPNVIFS